MLSLRLSNCSLRYAIVPLHVLKQSFLSCVGRDYFLYADVDYNCYHDVDDVTNLIDDYACRNKFVFYLFSVVSSRSFAITIQNFSQCIV